MAEGVAGSGGAYPPLGFKPVSNAELGNGDYFGLYWPYGREDREPIVCDMMHDGWQMEIAFSSVEIFLKYLDSNDGFRGDQVVEDSQSVVSRFAQVKSMLSNEPEQAISILQAVCADFPERSEYWYTLAAQLRRIGEMESAGRAGIRAFNSNWAFGFPSSGVLRLIQGVKGSIDDPVVRVSTDLRMRFGGTKENDDYRRLRECIEAYLQGPDPLPGIVLNQNYGYVMMRETVSFQERSSFQLETWVEEHRRLCARFLGDSRTGISE